ncbi:16S rRNA (guanine(527)-N(7))-methyltransferase RsmG [Exilibacterium tricleocarpae]|uniref:Ribosomal RNA small subunit methyltransferase G n=1 Tax=Exilibacterium tricleocarpae TaxID=2591008 RepID=A0A545TZW5_9GAMM|nr:16S rRNA (guanine(527)-N(7))-methyltransferase RsmG [Exilibacterium tricleocarpae]TQV82752.1 16S rRNA (guanine(527)-N(7))-methyltransferase RsmG [Exilibacterium tricleocarpae]
MGFDLEQVQVQQLLAYLALLGKWNRTYNLSAVRDVDDMLARHLLDSLSVAPLLRDAAGLERIVDVGSGGGLPGIPLAIAFPRKHITLVDSNGKKTRFLFQVKLALGLDNVGVEHCRVEDLQPSPGFDCVVSRAFASLADMTGGCEHLLAPNGRFWAMKGLYPTDELSVLAKHYKVEACHRLQVPGNEGERHLLILAPISRFS